MNKVIAQNGALHSRGTKGYRSAQIGGFINVVKMETIESLIIAIRGVTENSALLRFP